MDQRPKLDIPSGVTIREFAAGARIQIAFSYQGKECRELLPKMPINKSSIQRATVLREDVRAKIKAGDFNYAVFFPDSPRAGISKRKTGLMKTLLQKQLETYERQVQNGQMSPSTFNGYFKVINGERMKHWNTIHATEVTPSMLRDWIAEMDCTSKAIRNTLIPLRSVFEDALNDGLIEFNPFERIALAKLIRQTAKASDYVVQPFTHAERQAILSACRPDEQPTFLFWFNTGLRPGELAALEWSSIDLKKRIARITQNQVAGVIKGPKTEAGKRSVALNDEAIAALKSQQSISKPLGDRVWLNPRTLKPWSTDAQIRKTAWLPIMARSGIDYRNPYQIRHTFASSLLTAGANPWYVAQQLGHEDVEMVFRTYGKFISEDFQKPVAELRLGSEG